MARPLPHVPGRDRKGAAEVRRIAAVLILFAPALWGQATQGLISGRVVNRQTGAPIAGAAITWNSTSASNSGATKADSSGLYVIPLLPPGQYRLRASAGKFQPQEIYELEVPVAGRIDFDFRLRPLNDVWEAGQYRSVFLPGSKAVVTFYGPDVDTSKSAFVENAEGSRGALESTVSQVIDPAQIRDLPLAGRDVYTVLVTQPGATADTTTARGLGLAVNGQRPSASNFLLDGVENNNWLVTGPATAIAPEAVQEYRVSTANFTAEYGRTSGFIANAVTRSGSNTWHGTGYFYLKNDALDANGFQQNARGVARQPLKEAQPGYQASGRVLRDRLFVSSAFEDFRSRGLGEPTQYLKPTLALLDFTAPNSAARKLMQQYPDSFAPASKSLYATATARVPASVDRWLALERIDALPFGGAHRVFGRLAIASLKRPDFIWSPDPAFSTPLQDSTWNVAMGVQSTLRPTLTNEFRAARSTDDLHWDRAHPEIPSLVSLDGAVLPGSPAAYGYRNRSQGWEVLDNLTWVRGRHIFKAGASALLRGISGHLTAGRDGQYIFDSALSFALASPSFFSVSIARGALPQLQIPDFERHYRNRQVAFFAQDTFRVTHRLVFDYGARYENFGAPVNNGASKDLTLSLGSGADFRKRIAAATLTTPGAGDQSLYQTDGRGWAGRFGFSYALVPSGRSLLRGSYGIFYDRPFDNLWQNVRANNVVLPVFSVPTFTTDFLAPVASTLPQYRDDFVDTSFPSLTLLRGGLRNPFVHSYFLGVQQALPRDFALEVNTLGSLGRRLITTDIVNRRGDNPDLPNINYRANQGVSDYNALTVALARRGAHSQFHLAYTWSHTIDNQSEPLAGDFFDLSFSRVTSGAGRAAIAAFQREFDSSGDRGNSDFDQRHNLVFYSIWDLPGPLRQFKFAQVAAFRSGFPYTVYVPASIGPDGQVYINRRAGANSAVTAAAGTPEVAGGRQLLDPAVFVNPVSGVPGNTGRNAFRGPGLFNVDLSLSRTFTLPRLREGARLTVRADAFNFLNHANLNNPSVFTDAPDFGVAQYGRAGRDAGFPALTPLNETARQIQLLLRVEF